MNQITINSACVRSKSVKASCRTCVDGCPHFALSLTDEGEISLNTRHCDQCGYCVAACPVEAIQGNLPLRLIRNGAVYADTTIPPTIKELLIYYQNSCHTIVIANNESTWLSLIEQTNQVLQQIALTPFMITIDPLMNEALTAIKPASKGRRAFLKFGGSTHQNDKNIVKNKLLTQIFSDHQFFTVTLDKNSCSLCSACLRLCPTTAIKYEQRSFIIDNSRCVGCQLCQDACPEQALHIADDIKLKSLSSYPFISHVCINCKQHYLSVSEATALCTACRIKKSLNFNSQLVPKK